jgi:DedD protein
LSTPFQNRLVGTVIVAAVAIIALPDLLDGNKKTYQDEFESIPVAPKVDFVKNTPTFPQDKITKPINKKLSDEQAIDDQLVVKHENSEDTDGGRSSIKVNQQDTKHTSTKKELPEKSVLKQAWVIQLGSFRHKKNVDELLVKLKLNGYTAFSSPIKTKNGSLTKVFIGPELIKSSLEKKIPALKKLTNVQGKLARFYPTK